MEQTFLDLLAELKDFQRPHELQPAATPQEVASLLQRASDELSYSPPTFYLDLLKTIRHTIR